MSFQTQNHALLTFHSIILVFPMEITVKFVASSNIRDISVVQEIQLLAALDAAGSWGLLLLAFFFFFSPHIDSLLGFRVQILWPSSGKCQGQKILPSCTSSRRDRMSARYTPPYLLKDCPALFLICISLHAYR